MICENLRKIRTGGIEREVTCMHCRDYAACWAYNLGKKIEFYKPSLEELDEK
jgi:hypothetical protein